ncbi:hypothetical protein NFI96_014966 [Prochilodus magdalenae]|nr:hypothetical protein NFI96_014966 [Prochilodus magdalenae]
MNSCLLSQEKEQELEQLTKELRQVNLQQFIQQTGTKVTVLPAEPAEEEAGRAASQPHITKHSAERGTQRCKAPPLDSRAVGGVFSGVTNHASPSGDPMAESGFGGTRRTFGDGPFLFQHDRTPVHRASSIKTWRSESGVEELDWPAQSPDLHPIEHLWDGLGRRLRARPSRPTSVSDLTHVLLEE